MKVGGMEKRLTSCVLYVICMCVCMYVCIMYVCIDILEHSTISVAITAHFKLYACIHYTQCYFFRLSGYLHMSVRNSEWVTQLRYLFG